MAEEIDVVVVGAGQAGLSVSHELTHAGVDHVVLERDQVAASWRGRWDSFCLVTPNDTARLPGGEYAGADPRGFLPRDGVVAYLERYAAGFDAPVRSGVQVRSLRQAADGTLTLGTDDGTITARAVVAATGAFQRPHRPAWVAALPSRLAVLDARDYHNPGTLPAGAVLVVGSGQTGCQIAEELHLAGRDVILACGRAPWVPRQPEGRDIFYWFLKTRFMEMSVSSCPLRRPGCWRIPRPPGSRAATISTTARSRRSGSTWSDECTAWTATRRPSPTIWAIRWRSVMPATPTFGP